MEFIQSTGSHQETRITVLFRKNGNTIKFSSLLDDCSDCSAAVWCRLGLYSLVYVCIIAVYQHVYIPVLYSLMFHL